MTLAKSIQGCKNITIQKKFIELQLDQKMVMSAESTILHSLNEGSQFYIDKLILIKYTLFNVKLSNSKVKSFNTILSR